MLTRLATVTLVAAMSLSPPMEQNPPDEIALMKRVKAAFDPHNLLNPGKIFPS